MVYNFIVFKFLFFFFTHTHTYVAMMGTFDLKYMEIVLPFFRIFLPFSFFIFFIFLFFFIF